jgi:hypothetical protein
MANAFRRKNLHVFQKMSSNPASEPQVRKNLAPPGALHPIRNQYAC